LARLGGSRGTLNEQGYFSWTSARSFQALCKAAVDGTYGDVFFGDARSTEGYHKRLPDVVQNLNQTFSESMRTKGQRRRIIDVVLHQVQLADDSPDKPALPEVISRDEIIDHVRELLKRSRGRELLGTFNPLLLGEPFHEQSVPWEALARQHLHDVWNAAKSYLELTLAHLMDEDTFEGLLQHFVDPVTKEKLKRLNRKLDELLTAVQKGHPITYNHYFTRNNPDRERKTTRERDWQKTSSLLWLRN